MQLTIFEWAAILAVSGAVIAVLRIAFKVEGLPKKVDDLEKFQDTFEASLIAKFDGRYAHKEITELRLKHIEEGVMRIENTIRTNHEDTRKSIHDLRDKYMAHMKDAYLNGIRDGEERKT